MRGLLRRKSLLVDDFVGNRLGGCIFLKHRGNVLQERLRNLGGIHFLGNRRRLHLRLFIFKLAGAKQDVRLLRYLRVRKILQYRMAFRGTRFAVIALIICFCKLQRPNVGILLILELRKALYEELRVLPEHAVNTVAIYQPFRVVRLHTTEFAKETLGVLRLLEF